MSKLTITDLHASVITDEGETPILRGGVTRRGIGQDQRNHGS